VVYITHCIQTINNKPNKVPSTLLRTIHQPFFAHSSSSRALYLLSTINGITIAGAFLVVRLGIVLIGIF
jgi:hypothetical protein